MTTRQNMMMQRPFNIYAVGKELYNIPDDRLREFLTDFPQAVKLSPEQVKTGIQPVCRPQERLQASLVSLEMCPMRKTGYRSKMCRKFRKRETALRCSGMSRWDCPERFISSTEYSDGPSTAHIPRTASPGRNWIKSPGRYPQARPLWNRLSGTITNGKQKNITVRNNKPCANSTV